MKIQGIRIVSNLIHPDDSEILWNIFLCTWDAYKQGLMSILKLQSKSVQTAKLERVST